MQAHSADGRLIEAFDATEAEDRHPVYNIMRRRAVDRVVCELRQRG
ncbi:hypothetical protein LP419_17535 [Massilia sp. H-1]|nr:hypothetical protein LP419_17535 [Massilia sp. H-1]